MIHYSYFQIQTDEYDISTPYIAFLRNNIATIRESVKDDALVGGIFEVSLGGSVEINWQIFFLGFNVSRKRSKTVLMKHRSGRGL